jgi:hypothetical protein
LAHRTADHVAMAAPRLANILRMPETPERGAGGLMLTN